MTDSRLNAANQLLGEKAVILFMNDGSTMSGEPYTVDVAGIFIEDGPHSNFVPWTSIKRVYYETARSTTGGKPEIWPAT